MSSAGDNNEESLTSWILDEQFSFPDNSHSLPDAQLSLGTRLEGERNDTIVADPQSAEPSATQTAQSSEEAQNESNSKARRRVQNRIAQRAFRERKQSYAKDLQSRVESLEAQVERLKAEKNALEHVLRQAKADNERLSRELSQRPENPIATTLLGTRRTQLDDDTGTGRDESGGISR